MSTTMLIYEVNLHLESSIATKYQSWLPEHIDHLLALPGFLSAEIYTRDPDDSVATQNRVLVTVQYKLKDRESLERYLREDAPRMRKAASDLFGDKFSATRRVLEFKTEMKRPK